VNLRFLCNPIRFQADESDPSKLGSVVCERTRLEGEPGAQRAVGTGEEETLQAQLVSETESVYLHGAIWYIVLLESYSHSFSLPRSFFVRSFVRSFVGFEIIIGTCEYWIQGSGD
jgi:hypothetical protein